MAIRVIIACLVGLTAVSTDLYLPGIPDMTAELGGTPSQGQWTLSAFVLGSATAQLIYGSLSDYYGRKPVLNVGLVLFLIATMVCAFIDSMNGLIAARFVQGLGAAAGPVLARAIVNDRYDGIEATQLMATIAGSMAILPAVAPIGGSALLLVSDWRSLFLVLAAFGIFTLLGSRRIPESCPSIGEGKLQLNRVFLQFPECLKNPRFRGFALCGAATFSAMFCYISSASFLMMELMQVSTANFGYTFACVVSGYIVGAMTVSRKIAEWGQLRLLNYGQYCGRAGAAGLLLLAFTGFSSLPLLLASVTLIFLASGLSLSLSQMGAIREFQQRAGAASAVFGFMQLAGGAALSFLVGQAYDGSLLPAAIGISAAILLSGAGHRLIKAELQQT